MTANREDVGLAERPSEISPRLRRTAGLPTSSLRDPSTDQYPLGVEEQPATRYAKTADGAHIAYQVTGDGPLDVIELSSGGVSSRSMQRTISISGRRYVERLGRFSRLIRFDVRGVGLRDPLPPIRDSLSKVVSPTCSLCSTDAGADQPCVLTATRAGTAPCCWPPRIHPSPALILIHCLARVLQAPTTRGEAGPDVRRCVAKPLRARPRHR